MITHGLINLGFYSIATHLVFFSLPLVATFKGKGTVVLVALLCLLHLKDFWANRSSFKSETIRVSKTCLGIACIGFLVWCFLSSFWSEFPFRSLTNVSRYGFLAFLGYCLYKTSILLPPEKKSILSKAFFRGYIFYLSFFLFEIFVFPLASKIYADSIQFNSQLFIKGIVNLGFLFWPFLFSLSKYESKISFSKTLLFASAILMFILINAAPDAARAGILLGLSGALFVYYKPKSAYVFSVIFSVFSVLAPWIFTSYLTPETLGSLFHYLPLSYQHRFFIWHAMSKKALESPLIGHGFDYATTLAKGPIMCLKKIYFSWQLYPLEFSFSPLVDIGCGHIFTSHPHNGIVQIWVELGLIGIILFLGIFWLLTSKIVSIKNPAERGAYFGLLLFYTVIMLVSSGLWQKWIMATIILAFVGFCAIKDDLKIPLKKG